MESQKIKSGRELRYVHPFTERGTGQESEQPTEGHPPSQCAQHPLLEGNCFDSGSGALSALP